MMVLYRFYGHPKYPNASRKIRNHAGCGPQRWVPHLDGIHLATPREEDVINELSPLLRAFTMDFLATKKKSVTIAGDQMIQMSQADSDSETGSCNKHYNLQPILCIIIYIIIYIYRLICVHIHVWTD